MINESPTKLNQQHNKDYYGRVPSIIKSSLTTYFLGMSEGEDRIEDQR